MTARPRSFDDCSVSSHLRRLFRREVFWPVVVAALIVTASSRARVAAPQISPVDDKVVHFAVYGLLGTLVCRLGSGWRAAGWSLLVVSGFGATDEWHQSFVPGRSTELADWVADTAGAALAIALYVGSSRYRGWLERPIWRRQRRIEKPDTIAKLGAP